MFCAHVCNSTSTGAMLQPLMGPVCSMHICASFTSGFGQLYINRDIAVISCCFFFPSNAIRMWCHEGKQCLPHYKSSKKGWDGIIILQTNNKYKFQ